MNEYIARAFVVFMVLLYSALTVAMVFAAFKWWIWPRIKRSQTGKPHHARQTHLPGR